MRRRVCIMWAASPAIAPPATQARKFPTSMRTSAEQRKKRRGKDENGRERTWDEGRGEENKGEERGAVAGRRNKGAAGHKKELVKWIVEPISTGQKVRSKLREARCRLEYWHGRGELCTAKPGGWARDVEVVTRWNGVSIRRARLGWRNFGGWALRTNDRKNGTRQSEKRYEAAGFIKAGAINTAVDSRQFKYYGAPQDHNTEGEPQREQGRRDAY